METNRKIRAVFEWLSGTLYKRYRVYRKNLSRGRSAQDVEGTLS